MLRGTLTRSLEVRRKYLHFLKVLEVLEVLVKVEVLEMEDYRNEVSLFLESPLLY